MQGKNQTDRKRKVRHRTSWEKVEVALTLRLCDLGWKVDRRTLHASVGYGIVGMHNYIRI